MHSGIEASENNVTSKVSELLKQANEALSECSTDEEKSQKRIDYAMQLITLLLNRHDPEDQIDATLLESLNDEQKKVLAQGYLLADVLEDILEPRIDHKVVELTTKYRVLDSITNEGKKEILKSIVKTKVDFIKHSLKSIGSELDIERYGDLNEIQITLDIKPIETLLLGKQLGEELLLETSKEELKETWNALSQKFNQWQSTNSKADLVALASDLIALNMYILSLAYQINPGLGADDKPKIFEIFYNMLKRENSTGRFNDLDANQQQALASLFESFTVIKGSKELSPQVENQLPNSQEASESEVLKNTNLTFLNIAADNFSLAFKGLTNALGLIMPPVEPPTVESTSYEIATGLCIQEIRKFTHYEPIFQSQKKIIDLEKKFEKLLLRDNVEQKKAIPKKIQKVSTLRWEDQARLRHNIEVEKYSISDHESKLLAKAINSPEIIKIIPDQEIETHDQASERKAKGIVTYTEYLQKTEIMLRARIGSNQSIKYFRGLRQKPTDSIKAAHDFVQYMKFKYDTATHPHIHLKSGQQRNSSARNKDLKSKMKLVGTVDGNITERSTFAKLFKKTTDKLFSFRSSIRNENNALKELSKVHEDRIHHLNKRKPTTDDLPKKPETSKLSKGKRIKAEEKWDRKKGKRNTYMYNSPNVFNLFAPLSAAMKSYTSKPVTDEESIGVKLAEKDQIVKLQTIDTQGYGFLHKLITQLTIIYEDHTGKETDARKSVSADKEELDFSALVSGCKLMAETIKELESLFNEDYNNLEYLSKKELAPLEIQRIHKLYASDLEEDAEREINIDLLKEAIRTKILNSFYKYFELSGEQQNIVCLTDKIKILVNKGISLKDNALRLSNDYKKEFTLPKIRQGLHTQFLQKIHSFKSILEDKEIVNRIAKINRSSNDALKEIGEHVESIEAQVTQNAKEMQELGKKYCLYLAAEIDARQDLKKILDSLSADNLDISLKNQKNKIENIILSIDNRFSDVTTKDYTLAKFHFILSSLDEITPDNFAATKQENERTLNGLENSNEMEYSSITNLIKSVKDSAEKSVDGLKYLTSHGTSHFGPAVDI